MRILLIHPYVTSDSPNTILTEPLGLACLASYLNDGHEVEILDLFALGFDEIKKVGTLYRKGLSDANQIISLIGNYDPEIVGITCNFTAYASDAFEIAKLTRDHFKNILIIIGGAHVSMDAENTLKHNNSIDIVVRGEGEITFKEIVESLENGKRFELINGISYKNKMGEIKTNPDRELIENLNVLPVPDRKKLQMDFYLKTNSLAMPFAKREPVATIITSRGCPYNCVFCSTKAVWRRKWRPRSPEKVIEEIRMLVKDYGVKEVAILDDQFIVNRKRVNQICDMLIENDLNITLSIPSGTSIWIVDKNLLRKMKKAGFYRLCFPIESGNKKTLEFIKKPVNLVKAKEIIKLANKIGIWTQGNFIIGFPYETRAEMQTTINYAYHSGLDYALFFIAKPYAGSEMYEICKKEGLLTNIFRGSNIESADYDTKTMKASEIQVIRDNASRSYLFYKIKFYINPLNFYNYLLTKLSCKEDLSYAIKILIMIIKKTLKET